MSTTSSLSAKWTGAAASLLASARALIYPVQTAEPFGLVLAEPLHAARRWRP